MNLPNIRVLSAVLGVLLVVVAGSMMAISMLMLAQDSPEQPSFGTMIQPLMKYEPVNTLLWVVNSIGASVIGMMAFQRVVARRRLRWMAGLAAGLGALAGLTVLYFLWVSYLLGLALSNTW